MAKITIENGLTVNYEIEGQGEPVVLVQGLDGDINGMIMLRKELAKHYQVIAYDARGTGQSDVPEGPYTCRQMADDLAGLLKALKITKAHIVGASMGGNVSQEFAINYPEMTGKLVLMCTFAKPDYFLENIARFWRDTIGTIGHSRLVEEVIHWVYTREFTNQNKELIDGARNYLRAMEPAYSVPGFQAKADSIITADTSHRLQNIKAHTLVIAGELDYLIPTSICEELGKSIKGAEYAVIKQAAHAFFDEKPAEVNECVLNFLRRGE